MRLSDIDDEIPDNYAFCGEKATVNDAIYDMNNTFIFKCKKCGRLDGYRYIDDDDDFPYVDIELDDCQYPRKTLKIAKEEGKPIISASAIKKITKTLKKNRNDPKLKCKEHLNNLIKEQNETLKMAEIDTQILEDAITQANYSIQTRGPYTEKQLKILLPAAILEAQETLLLKGKTPKKVTTERELMKIFGTDRKTIRKWKKRLNSIG